MMQLLPGPDRPFTGRHMAAVVLLFFGTIIVVNIVMATAAIRTFPGLNAHNSYVASQTYNLLLGDAATQAKLGWWAEIGVSPDRRVRLALRDRSGTLLRGFVVTALAGRPASAAEDRTLAFDPTPEGYQAAEALDPGRWLVEIEARKENRLVWRETHRVSIAGPGAAP